MAFCWRNGRLLNLNFSWSYDYTNLNELKKTWLSLNQKQNQTVTILTIYSQNQNIWTNWWNRKLLSLPQPQHLLPFVVVKVWLTFFPSFLDSAAGMLMRWKGARYIKYERKSSFHWSQLAKLSSHRALKHQMLQVL